MAKAFAAFVLSLAVTSVMLGLATALAVDGGTLQVFHYTAAVPTQSPTATATQTIPAPDPTSQPPGAAGTSLEAAVTASGFRVDALAGVRGEICVANAGSHPTADLSLAVQVQYHVPGGPFSDLPGVALAIAPVEPLAAGGTGCFPYEMRFVPAGDAAYRAAARVTITNHAGHLPGSAHCPGAETCPFGPEPKADFDLLDPADGAAATLVAVPELPSETPGPTGTATATEAIVPTGAPAPTSTPLTTETAIPAWPSPSGSTGTAAATDLTQPPIPTDTPGPASVPPTAETAEPPSTPELPTATAVPGG